MTIAQQILYVKRKSRTSSNALTQTYADDVVRNYLNDGAREFSKNAHGVPKEAYLTIAPSFSTRTNWAIRLTITGGANALAATDIAVTATDRDDVAGSTIASDLETAIQAAGAATATVAWSDTDWTFTIDAGDSTSITVAQPSGKTYVDATENLFGTAGEKSGTTWESGFPMDCTLETDLPSDFMEMVDVYWGPYLLTSAPIHSMIEPRRSGTPAHYYIEDKLIRLAPVPTSQDKFHIYYMGYTTDVTLTGSSDTATCSLPMDYHMAPVYYAAAQVLEDNFEYDEANRMRALFQDQVSDYSLKKANQNSKIQTVGRPARIPRVNFNA